MKKQHYWLIAGAAVAGTLMVAVMIKYHKKIVDAGVDYVLSENQKATIAKLHKTAQEPFRKLITEMEKRGYKVLVTSSYRTWADQDKQHQLNPTKVPPAGGGYHNYGMALDINIVKGDKHYKMATPTAEWLKTGIPQMAEAMGFKWGGRFNNYPDHVHFDYRKYDSKELKKLAIAQFGSNPANIQGNKVRVA